MILTLNYRNIIGRAGLATKGEMLLAKLISELCIEMFGEHCVEIRWGNEIYVYFGKTKLNFVVMGSHIDCVLEHGGMNNSHGVIRSVFGAIDLHNPESIAEIESRLQEFVK